jgi:predicted MFS family arabinose efflux permease
LSYSISIFLLSLAAFASAASMRVTDALLPRLAADFHVGIGRAAAVVTGFAVAYGLMQVVFGPLGDRFGKLRVISISALAASLATLACQLAPGFDGLLVARIFAGAFCGSIIPLAIAWIGDVVPYRDRQPVIARFILGQISGLACGAALGGFAAERDEWRWVFGLLAAWLAICAVFVAFASRRDPVPRTEKVSHFARDAAGILTSRWACIVVATVFVEGMVVFGALAFVPTHLHFVRGMELSRAGMALIPYAAGGIAFALGARTIVPRLGEAQLSRAGTVLLMAGFLIVAWSPWVPLSIAGCFIAGLGFYALHNTLQTNGTQMAPERRGAAMALFASLFFLGQSLGVAIAGALVERAGTTAVLTGGAFAVLPVGFAFAALKAAHERTAA